MKLRTVRALCLMFILAPASLALANDQADGILNAQPGRVVQENVAGLNTTDTIGVKLDWAESASPPTGCDRELQPSNLEGPSLTGFSFTIPPTICAGLYTVSATRKLQAAVNGTITSPESLVLSTQNLRVSEQPPNVTGVSPKAFYRDDKEPFSLVFLGTSSLKAGTEYGLRLDDHPLANCITTVTTNGVTTSKESSSNCFKFDEGASQDGQISFTLKDGSLLSDLSGKHFVSLVHNGAESQGLPIFFVDVNRTTPRNAAFAVTAVLVTIVYLLLSTGRKAQVAGTDKKTFLLTALFLDEETQTYSLSKCQFYAWTLTAVAGYVFLAIAKTVIQGNAVFPDIPAGLPGILLASAGTSVLATGITSSRGTKGAGQVHPTLADFVTSGGVVAPERLQFVVWTIIGIFTFLTIVFKSDPLSVQDLPSIPNGFMELMGISSAGYLAGKLARKPGPVIKVLSVANVTPDGGNLPALFAPAAAVQVRLPVLSMSVKGENLDPNAVVKVDGQTLRGDMYWIKSDPPDAQTGFCTDLTVTLNDAGSCIEGSHTLTIVNGDAQSADVQFPIDPMTIDAVDVPAAPPAAVNPPQDVTVTGKNFVSGTRATWQDQGGMTIPGVVNVTVTNATSLTLSRLPGATRGSGFKLVLISPAGLIASKNI